MTVQEIKAILKERKITYEELSRKSNIPLNTLKQIFRGRTQHPRIDTMNAIEKALGLNDYKDDVIANSKLIKYLNYENISSEDLINLPDDKAKLIAALIKNFCDKK